MTEQIIRSLPFVLMSLLLLSCTSAEKSLETSTSGFRASGSEPEWFIDMDFEKGISRLSIEREDSFDKTIHFPPPTRGVDSRQMCYTVPVESYLIELVIDRSPCESTTLNSVLPYTATVTISDFRSRVEVNRLEGCGQYNGLGELTRSWRLVKFDGEEISAVREGERLPSIQFFLSEGKINGDGGCNYFTGDLALEGDSIRIGQIPSTKMACPRIGRESAYIGALREKAHEMKFEDGRLTLKSEFHEMEFTIE